MILGEELGVGQGDRGAGDVGVAGALGEDGVKRRVAVRRGAAESA